MDFDPGGIFLSGCVFMKPADNKRTFIIFLSAKIWMGALVLLAATLFNAGCSRTPKKELNYTPGKGWVGSPTSNNNSDQCLHPSD
jgi:uncharacterized lipoprotein YajG